MSDASRHAIYAIAETVYGTTPANPHMETLRISGTTLSLTKEEFMSEELRPDRQITDYRHGNKSINGAMKSQLTFGTFDLFLQALLCGTWVDDVLKVGVTRRSFSVLRHFTDIADVDEPYLMFKGIEFNTFKMTLAPGKPIPIEFNIIGQSFSIGAAKPAGTVLNAPTETRLFDGFTGELLEAGESIGIITGLDLVVDNGLQPRWVLFSDETIRPSIGRSHVSGKASFFFETSKYLKKFVNSENSSIQFTLNDPDGNSYTFTLPNICYSGGQPDVDGEGPVTLSMDFKAIYSSADGSQIIVSRVAD